VKFCCDRKRDRKKRNVSTVNLHFLLWYLTSNGDARWYSFTFLSDLVVFNKVPAYYTTIYFFVDFSGALETRKTTRYKYMFASIRFGFDWILLF